MKTNTPTITDLSYTEFCNWQTEKRSDSDYKELESRLSKMNDYLSFMTKKSPDIEAEFLEKLEELVSGFEGKIDNLEFSIFELYYIKWIKDEYLV